MRSILERARRDVMSVSRPETVSVGGALKEHFLRIYQNIRCSVTFSGVAYRASITGTAAPGEAPFPNIKYSLLICCAPHYDIRRGDVVTVKRAGRSYNGTVAVAAAYPSHLQLSVHIHER